MRWICTRDCDISPFGHCVVTTSEKDSNFMCPKDQEPIWKHFDNMGGTDRQTEMMANFDWFKEHYEILYEQFGTGYVVIVDQRFQACLPTIQEALEYVEERGIEIYNIQFNDGTPGGFTTTIYTPFFTI